MKSDVDVLFANRNELAVMYETTDLRAGVEAARADVELACITLGKEGSMLVTRDDVVEIEAAEIAPVVDTTGAGDQYAAGVLFGLAHGLGLRRAGELGSLAAAEVISHVGPPRRSRCANLPGSTEPLARAATPPQVAFQAPSSFSWCTLFSPRQWGSVTLRRWGRAAPSPPTHLSFVSPEGVSFSYRVARCAHNSQPEHAPPTGVLQPLPVERGRWLGRGGSPRG
ncbi:MAG: PfkB family carbohydrate kinase [Acidimicrobiales bacterium]